MSKPSMFQRASRKRVYLKIGLMGASGSGKSRSALELAKGLAKGGPIAAIDTENGSLSLYSHVTQFDVVDMAPPFDPEKYIEAIYAAEEAGYPVLVIDSFTHAWKYLLNKKEALDNRGGRQNPYANWGPVKAEADRLKDAILQSRLHIIACMRSKTEYAQEGGKVTKVGLAAVQEPDVEYEFTTVFQIDMAHNSQQTKDRTGLWGDRVFRIDDKTGLAYLNWLESADAQEVYVPPSGIAPPVSATPNVPDQRPTATEPKTIDPGAAFLKAIGLVPSDERFKTFKAIAVKLEKEFRDMAADAQAEGADSIPSLLEYAAALDLFYDLGEDCDDLAKFKVRCFDGLLPWYQVMAEAQAEGVAEWEQLDIYLSERLANRAKDAQPATAEVAPVTATEGAGT